MATVQYQIEGSVAIVTIDRPEVRNAVDGPTAAALVDAFQRFEDDAALSAAVLTGAGGHFCAGADIGEFETVYRDAEATRDYTDAIQDGLAALVALDRPTIAALRGNAIGGGLALALCCDLRFCADDAYLAITPAKLGILYGFIETRRLVEAVGPARAKDLLFSGRRVECAEALAIGLIDRLVAAAGLEATIDAYAAELALLSQHSIRGAKIAVEAIAGGLETESPAFRALIKGAAMGEDFAEGRAAFLAKRRPAFRFRGRLDPLD
jgi:enoyl-CoA hydratase/carnithine racemase